MSDAAAFVETKEYRRFSEFCDACRRNRYIGLCYGPPGVGKTLSARRYANWDQVAAFDPYAIDGRIPLEDVSGSEVVLYTPPVVNTPKVVERDIQKLRETLRGLREAVVQREEEPRFEKARQEFDAQTTLSPQGNWVVDQNTEAYRRARRDFEQARLRLVRRIKAIADPTALVVVDEADRMKMTALEQVRDLFDRGHAGFVLIGMPGIQKRLSRYPQLYSRVGFVHEFRPLARAEIRELLTGAWSPPGVCLPEGSLTDEEGVAAIARITGGNFRLLHRLLTQVARVLEINSLDRITRAVVEVARESLVIGTD
jgi:hypothetical protein